MGEALASLRLWGVSVVIGEHGFHVPPQPAADWIDAIVTNSMLDLLPTGDAERLTDLVAGGDIESVALQRAFMDAITEAAGREWHIAARLVSLLFQDDLRGEVLSVIDPQVRSFAAVLDVTYATCVRWKSEQQRTTFDGMIFAPAESGPITSDPRERAQQMREESKRLLSYDAAESAEASEMPSTGTPPTSD